MGDDEFTLIAIDEAKGRFNSHCDEPDSRMEVYKVGVSQVRR